MCQIPNSPRGYFHLPPFTRDAMIAPTNYPYMYKSYIRFAIIFTVFAQLACSSFVYFTKAEGHVAGHENSSSSQASVNECYLTEACLQSSSTPIVKSADSESNGNNYSAIPIYAAHSREFPVKTIAILRSDKPPLALNADLSQRFATVLLM